MLTFPTLQSLPGGYQSEGAWSAKFAQTTRWHQWGADGGWKRPWGGTPRKQATAGWPGHNDAGKPGRKVYHHIYSRETEKAAYFDVCLIIFSSGCPFKRVGWYQCRVLLMHLLCVTAAAWRAGPGCGGEGEPQDTGAGICHGGQEVWGAPLIQGQSKVNILGPHCIHDGRVLY